jgi:Na+-driven multidrug efflux pump
MQKGAPLLINEALWSVGMATLMQTYSVRGLTVLAGLNIASTITNLFNVVLMSMGNAVAVIVGQALGANELARAKGDAWKLMFFNFASCTVVGGILAALSPVLPHMYPTTGEVYQLAARFILTSACMMPINAVTHCSYFTLRSGGSVMITFLFDSAFSWVIAIPFAAFLAYGTALPILILYPISQGIELITSVIGLILVKKGVWIRNMVSALPTEAENAV